METGRIALSRRERDRLKVLREFKQKHLTQVEAARWLRLRDRQVRRLLVRIEGVRGSSDRASITRSAIEPQAGSDFGADDFWRDAT